MKKIFTKEEAQKLEFADAVHVWMRLYDIHNKSYYTHWNAFIWKIYGTRLDLHGLSKRDWGLTWNTYGTKWLLSTPINSYDNRNNISVENVKCYLENGTLYPVIKVKRRECEEEILEENANVCNFSEYNEDKDNVVVYSMRGGSVCSECYDEHGWRYE